MICWATALKNLKSDRRPDGDALEISGHCLDSCRNCCLLSLGIRNCRHLWACPTGGSARPASACQRLNSVGAKLLRRRVCLSPYSTEAEDPGSYQLAPHARAVWVDLLPRKYVVSQSTNTWALPAWTVRLNAVTRRLTALPSGRARSLFAPASKHQSRTECVRRAARPTLRLPDEYPRD